MTKTQIRIIYLTAAGSSQLTIALKMGLARSTITTQLSALRRKYNIRTRNQFVDFAVSSQIITEDRVKRGLEWRVERNGRKPSIQKKTKFVYKAVTA